jgi:hypothetical protein
MDGRSGPACGRHGNATSRAERRRFMRKLTLLLAVLVVAVAAPAAFGGSPHFIKNATSSSISGSTLICNFKEAGLESGSTETITCSATEAVTYECVNGGGKNPSASNKTTFQVAAQSSGEFTADKNGNLVGSQQLPVTSPGDLNFSCPSGQRLVLVSVFYTNVTVTDQTSGATASLADQSFVNPSAP